jgi:integrase
MDDNFKLDADFIVKAQPPQKDRKIYWDPEKACFGFVITANGHRSFVVQYRVPGRSRRMTIDTLSPWPAKLEAKALKKALLDARAKADALMGQVKTGRLLGKPIDPLAARRHAEALASGTGTFEAIAADWLNRQGKEQRSGQRRFDELDRLVFPRFGKRLIGDIRRSDIVKLLDAIKEENGPSMADFILAATRRVMSWHESRDDDFMSPIRKDMAKVKAKDRARKRILTDDELRAVWRAAEADTGPYGALLRFILLTATRREEPAQMPRSELSGAEWTIPASRYKTEVDHMVPLSAAAMALIDGLPRIGDGKFVFTVSGRVPIGGFSKRKANFDRACGVTGWMLRDLRRTSRSLLSRAGIDADTAERCLGHVITGVRGVYDRHDYREEKAHAFEALARQIARIITPADNVIPLPDRRVSQVPA